MHATAVEIEQIVKVVLERLRNAAAPQACMPMSAKVESNPLRIDSAATTTSNSDELILTDSVITLATLSDRLGRVTSVRVPSRAIVTPAVQDLLRKQKIQLIRASRSAKPQTAVSVSSAASSILVCGSADWLSSVSKQIDARLATIAPSEDAVAASLVEEHLGASGTVAVWATATPYSVISKWHLNRRACAIHLHELSQFAPAMQEAQAKLIVISSESWTPAAVGNLVRQWSRSL